MNIRVKHAYQFRYLAYAAAHGLSPAAMFRHDRRRRPSAPGLGFVLWMGEQRSAWEREHERAMRTHLHSSLVHSRTNDEAAFDSWLRATCFLRQMGKRRAPERLQQTARRTLRELLKPENDPRRRAAERLCAMSQARLVCAKCDREEMLTIESTFRYLAGGWPRCCNLDMEIRTGTLVMSPQIPPPSTSETVSDRSVLP
jgi:hypothetical protein